MDFAENLLARFPSRRPPYDPDQVRLERVRVNNLVIDGHRRLCEAPLTPPAERAVRRRRMAELCKGMLRDPGLDVDRYTLSAMLRVYKTLGPLKKIWRAAKASDVRLSLVAKVNYVLALAGCDLTTAVNTFLSEVVSSTRWSSSDSRWSTQDGGLREKCSQREKYSPRQKREATNAVMSALLERPGEVIRGEGGEGKEEEEEEEVDLALDSSQGVAETPSTPTLADDRSTPIDRWMGWNQNNADPLSLLPSPEPTLTALDLAAPDFATLDPLDLAGLTGALAVLRLFSSMSSPATSLLPSPDRQSYTLALAAASSLSPPSPSLASAVYERARERGVALDGRGVNALIRSHGKDVDGALKAWKVLRVDGFVAGVFRGDARELGRAYRGLLYVAGSAGRADVAVRILSAMKKENVAVNESHQRDFLAGAALYGAADRDNIWWDVVEVETREVERVKTGEKFIRFTW